METRMKNKDAKAMNYRRGKEKKRNTCYISNCLNLDVLYSGSGYIHKDQSVHLLLRERVNSDKFN